MFMMSFEEAGRGFSDEYPKCKSDFTSTKSRKVLAYQSKCLSKVTYVLGSFVGRRRWILRAYFAFDLRSHDEQLLCTCAYFLQNAFHFKSFHQQVMFP
jgi:hypothetical protein